MLDTNVKMTSIIIHVILSRLLLYDEVFLIYYLKIIKAHMRANMELVVEWSKQILRLAMVEV